MKQFQLLLLSLCFLICQNLEARQIVKKHDRTPESGYSSFQCVAFSPYVGALNPDQGNQPSPDLINKLLDRIVDETPFRCIMTYGVLNGLDVIFPAAKSRQMKVIAIIWLDQDFAVNSQSIAKGIELARAYPETIIRLSCGSEIRTRRGYQLDGEIKRCIDAFHEAKVKQPVTTIDVWWEWCNRSKPCQPNSFSGMVDWIGINVFPWWENRFADMFPCIPADKAAEFHRARMEEVSRVHSGKEVILTEFGWPTKPEGGQQTNIHTGQQCALAGTKNQELVIQSTLNLLAEKNWSGIVFEAFSEEWKSNKEGQFGVSWGICQGEPPYHCNRHIGTGIH